MRDDKQGNMMESADFNDTELVSRCSVCRQWEDAPEATPDDLDALAGADEAAWIAEQEALMLYKYK